MWTVSASCVRCEGSLSASWPSDVKQSTLDNIVRGLTKNPRVNTLYKIAIAFNMTLVEFLDFEELNVCAFDEVEE